MRVRLSRYSLFSVLCTLVGVGLLLVMYDTLTHTTRPPQRLLVVADAQIEVSAASAFIMDYETGTEIYAKDPDTQRPVASITKLLSSAMFYEYATATATTTIGWQDVATEGRSGRLVAGEQYLNQELLFPALLESSNDAASTMERVAPVNLVDSMNTYAAEQHLQQTSFTDASGLSSENVSTARELSTLGVALHHEYPHVFDITLLRQYLNHVNAWMNNNPLIAEEGYVGGKHGYTYEANRTVIAFFDEVLPSGATHRFVYVVLGSDDVSTDMAHMRSYVQNNVDYK